MTYAHVVAGAVEREGLPTTGELSDGRTVSNYHLLDDATLADEGWLPVVEEPATWDPAERRVVGSSFRVEADRVVRVLELDYHAPTLNVDRGTIPPDGTTKARVSYRHPDPATRVDPAVFTVNGATVNVPFVGDVAELDVTAAQAGTVDVSVGDLTATITVA